MSREKRLSDAERRTQGRQRNGLVLTAGLSSAECAAAYKRHLEGESWREIFPDAELPDGLDDDSLVANAADGLSAHELNTLYSAMVHAKGSE